MRKLLGLLILSSLFSIPSWAGDYGKEKEKEKHHHHHRHHHHHHHHHEKDKDRK
jgi:hypothetical protein